MAPGVNKDLCDERHENLDKTTDKLDKAIDKLETKFDAGFKDLVKVTTQLVTEVQALQVIHAPGTQADRKSNRIAIYALIIGVLMPVLYDIGKTASQRLLTPSQPTPQVQQKARPSN